MPGIGIGIGVHRRRRSSPVVPDVQYFYFDDGTTFMRKGARFVDPDQMFGVDVELTPTGWAGTEDTDFEMIYPILI